MANSGKLSLVIVGHVDHGKSTLIGRLLYETDSISNQKIEELKEASFLAENELEFAFLLDHLQEEREQGITIDTTQTFFKTEKREYIIIDAPGHVEFVRNMVTGASQADSALIIIDADEGIQQQTRRHAFILSMLGFKQVVVVINKMDKIGYDEVRFNNIEQEFKKILDSLQMHAKHYIPISALEGDNISNLSDKMSWYSGETVLEILDNLPVIKKDNDKIAVLPVQDVYKMNSKRIVVGKLEKGYLKKGDKVSILPDRRETNVKSIEKFLDDDCQQCSAGESIGLTTETPIFIERGNILSTGKENLIVNNIFKASIFWMDKRPLCVEDKIIFRCATQESVGNIVKIVSKIDSAMSNQIEFGLKELNNLDAGEVVIKTKIPVVISIFKSVESLGRFVLIRDNDICAGGIITAV